MTKKTKAAKQPDLFEAKLASSGLDLEDAKKLKMTYLTKEQVQKLSPSFKPLGSLRIAYLGPDGKPLSDWPNCGDFYRLRYLEKPTGFDGLSDNGKNKYAQLPDTVPVAYYPGNQDWLAIIKDTGVPLIITEGELKAAKACKEGFPTIAIGGVWNWKSNKHGLAWLPSLDFMDWRRRNVYLCFDSDLRTNANVLKALTELAEMLVRKGAYPHIVSLPDLPDLQKVGLDDYLMHAKPDPVVAFRQLLSAAEPLGMAEALWKFNDKYMVIRSPAMILDCKKLTKMSMSAFKDVEAPKTCEERSLAANGNVVIKKVAAAPGWLAWPFRAEAEKLTYAPGAERFPDGNFNMWPGWGVEPKKGDVKPFLQLLDHLFTGAEQEAKDWFLRWCAYPIQHPGTKLLCSVVFHGIKHGTGKSLIGYTLARIYGKNFTEISQMDLHNHFNEWAEGKQFVMGDDVTGPNKRSDADFLKKLITQQELRVNAKFIPTYTVPDCVNYFFTANHPDSFFLEDDDRRFFIHEVQVGPLSEEVYKAYDKWYRSEAGAAALFYHLAHLDLAAFNPNAPAFKTAAKERMIVTVQSDLAAWVRQLIATPEVVLKVGEVPVTKDLFTSKELLEFYDPTGKTGTTAGGLGRELQRAGLRQVCQGRPIRLSDGAQGRYYAVRSAETWLASTPKLVTEHVDKWAKQMANVAPLRAAKY